MDTLAHRPEFHHWTVAMLEYVSECKIVYNIGTSAAYPILYYYEKNR